MPQEKLFDLLNYEFYFLFLLFKFYQDVRQRISCRVLNFAEGVLAKLEKQRHDLGVNSFSVKKLSKLAQVFCNKLLYSPVLLVLFLGLHNEINVVYSLTFFNVSQENVQILQDVDLYFLVRFLKVTINNW